MSKYCKFLLILIICILSLTLYGCNDDIEEDTHNCLENLNDWKFDQEYPCESLGKQIRTCKICKEIVETKDVYVEHELRERTVDPLCDKEGRVIITCKNCDYEEKTTIAELGHVESEFILAEGLGVDEVGNRYIECTVCGKQLLREKFANNGHWAHGALSVNGADLVDERGEKVQLYGLSTHGIQWFGNFLTYKTFKLPYNNYIAFLKEHPEGKKVYLNRTGLAKFFKRKNEI